MSDTNEQSVASNGSHGAASRWNGVPVAWAAVGKNGVPMWLAYHRQDAGVAGMAEVVPLYRSPTLTGMEQAAIGWAIMECESMPTTMSREAADTLRALLKRLK
jgi:hypothetical protein